MKWSKYQTALFKAVESTTKNIRVSAVAGSGKTTSLLECLGRVEGRVLFVAFNKSIADELATRAPQGVEVRTFHSLCFTAIKAFTKGFVRVDDDKVKSHVFDYFDYKNASPENKRLCIRMLGPVSKTIGAMKNNAIVDESVNRSVVEQLMDEYGAEIPDGEDDTFWKIVTRVWSDRSTRKIDFDDMVWLVLAHKLSMPKYDVVFVDEAQDLNPTQIEVLKMMKPKRLIVVGDPFQSIYAFRGADVTAMDKLAAAFKMVDKPLSICYRCDEAIIKRVQRLVPHIESRPGAGPGDVSDVTYDDYQKKVVDGNYVLCRVNAPLVTEALKMIRNNRKAVVLGRDIGKGLLDLFADVPDNADADDVVEKVRSWMEKKLAKLNKKGDSNGAMAIEDKFLTIEALAEDCDHAGCIRQKINTLFSDTATGIVYSTVHKAKGRESDRVFILRPDLMPLPNIKKEKERQQERNIQYVAETRGRLGSHYVTNPTTTTAKEILNGPRRNVRRTEDGDEGGEME